MQINKVADRKCHLHDEYRRHTNQETQVLCLMPEHLHSKHGPDAAADSSGQKKRRFLDTPLIVLCSPLINEHQHKPGHIDNQ